MEGLEKERDFYFGKLRDIEVMCQEADDNNPIIQKILDVLYATEVSSYYINLLASSCFSFSNLSRWLLTFSLLLEMYTNCIEFWNIRSKIDLLCSEIIVSSP